VEKRLASLTSLSLGFMIIGIPRALIYWKRPYFWETFFESLGCKVILSPPTNKEIVEKGVKVADPETCFSNKVYWGHLLWFEDLEEKVDYIFIPLLKTNQEKLEYCLKFFGIPDLSKILVKTPILTETFDEKKEKFGKTVERLGKNINKSKRDKKSLNPLFFKRKRIKKTRRTRFF